MSLHFHPWILILGILLGACAPQQEIRREGLPLQLSRDTVDMERWPAPERLAGQFIFQGEINNPASQTRLLRYSDIDDPDHKLDITLYPIPAGWHDLPPSRLLGGHYGQVRQHLAERLMVAGVREIRISDEQMATDDELDIVVVSSRLEQRFDDSSRINRVVLAAHETVFVRASLASPAEQDPETARILREAFRDYLRSLKPDD